MTGWLTDPTDTEAFYALDGWDWPPCPGDYGDSAVRGVVQSENNDPLIAIPPNLSDFRIYSQMPLLYTPPQIMLRQSTIHRLSLAQNLLPPGFSFTIIDGWRTVQFQRELAGFYLESNSGVVDQKFVSDPGDSVVAPPHTTGGAVDLTLAFKGVPLALGTDFDSFNERASLDFFEVKIPEPQGAQDRLVLLLRRCMSDVLTRTGFAHYPREWWHWSFGDQWWAARYSLPKSLYSTISQSQGIGNHCANVESSQDPAT